MMTKGREISSLALRAAPGRLLPRRAVLLTAAALTLLVGMSVSTAVAKERTEDPIIVSNFGAITGGSWELFAAPTAGGNIPPTQNVIGPATALFGPQGIASSPFDVDVYVVASIVPAVFGFSPGSNGNSGTEFPIGCLPGLFTPPCVVGFDSPGGIAFGVSLVNGAAHPFPRLWVANNLPLIFSAVGKPLCAVGTLNAYIPDVSVLNSPPSPNNPVPINDGSGVSQNTTIGGCLTGLFEPEGVAVDSFENAIFAANFAAGYVGIYSPGNTFKVCGNASCSVVVFSEPTPGFGGFGDVSPSGAFAAPKTPQAGLLVEPEFIALDVVHDIAYVTDKAANSVVSFSYAPFEVALPPGVGGCPGAANHCVLGPFFATTLLGAVQGSNTALRTPLGIAVGADLDDFYVANTVGNKISAFDLEAPLSGTENISPDVVISGRRAKLNQPIGLSMDCFTDPTAPQCRL